MVKNKEVFTVKVDGKDIELAILRPNSEVSRQARIEYNKEFAALVKEGALLNASLDTHLESQGIWSDDKEEKRKELVKKINDSALNLKRGGLNIHQGRRMAIEMRRARAELQNLLAERNSYEANTAEGQAENARFNYLVTKCLVYNKDSGDHEEGEQFFKSVDEYLSDPTNPVSIEGFQRLGRMLYQLDQDFESKLPENKWLSEWSFVDEKLHLINDNGDLVDTSGRLVDEEGRYIDEDGNFIDINGNPVNEEGEYQVDNPDPFVDDDGNPITPEQRRQMLEERRKNK